MNVHERLKSICGDMYKHFKLIFCWHFWVYLPLRRRVAELGVPLLLTFVGAYVPLYYFRLPEGCSLVIAGLICFIAYYLQNLFYRWAFCDTLQDFCFSISSKHVSTKIFASRCLADYLASVHCFHARYGSLFNNRVKNLKDVINELESGGIELSDELYALLLQSVVESFSFRRLHAVWNIDLVKPNPLYESYLRILKDAYRQINEGGRKFRLFVFKDEQQSEEEKKKRWWKWVEEYHKQNSVEYKDIVRDEYDGICKSNPEAVVFGDFVYFEPVYGSSFVIGKTKERKIQIIQDRKVVKQTHKLISQFTTSSYKGDT